MTRREHWTMAALVLLSFLWPLLLGVFEANVGPQGNSVGTAQLRTATGSFVTTTLGITQVTMNDYAFFPSITNSNSNGNVDQINVADPNNTIATYGQNTTGGTTTTRWRYMTTSDMPTWWVVVDALGVIVSVWVSDDPPSPLFAGCPVSPLPIGAICRKIFSSDLQGLGLPPTSYAQGDQWIRLKGYSMSNRDFRAIQQHAGDLAPAPWIRQFLKVTNNVLVPMSVLPPPASVSLQIAVF